MIAITDDTMTIKFDRFDLAAYDTFLKCKRLPESRVEFDERDESYRIVAPARFASMLGMQPTSSAATLPLADFLMDDQAAIVPMALAAKRFACWSGCGLGKTAIGLEVGRHVIHRTNRPGLIMTVNEVVNQWIEEAKKFYGDNLPIIRLNSRDEMRNFCARGSGLAVTNYEKMNYKSEGVEGQVVTEFQNLGFIALDEATRVNTPGGKQKWALIKSAESIEYKLLLTATPAPNDLAEFMSQAGFLNKFTAEHSITTYFTRDNKTHRWTVKPHARKALFEFMSTWSIYVNDPRKFGWRLNVPEVPPPIIKVHKIDPTPEQTAIVQAMTRDERGQGTLMVEKELNTIQRMQLSQVAKGFRYRKGRSRDDRVELIPSDKPAFVADLIRSEVKARHQVLVWTIFDHESQVLMDQLGARYKADRLTGSTPADERLEMLERFRRGESKCLISLASMLGFGMNMQHCTSMIFSGWSDSFVQYYQALRRAYRFGQTKRLRVHVPVIEDLEGDQLQNIFRKESEHNRAIDEMEQNYIRAYKTIRGAA